jgi:hypothetical protein
MKKIITLVFFLTFSVYSFSQITIGTGDFAAGGDTIRLSIANAAPANTSLATNGANALWDYSGLVPNTQDVDSLLSVTSTGITYAIFFANLPFNPNRANIAAKGANLAGGGGAVPITDVYNYFYNSSSNYKQVGFGATISGVTTPIPYGSKDIVYSFPCNFGNVDSSDSDYSISIPSQGAAVGQQRRVNNVDGWGTLITPFGTFNTLRVVSELTGKDSVFISSIGFGLSFPRTKTREYKWLTTNGKVPVLQINVNVNGQNETVTSIRYKDIYRDLTVGLANNPQPIDAKIFPNPSNGENVSIELSTLKNGQCEIGVYAINGTLLKSISKNAVQGRIALDEFNDIADGYYTITLRGELGTASLNWLKK